LNAVATVTSVATAYETELIKTGAVCLGEGLSSAFKGALAALHASTFVDDMICDLNGETYRADEFAFTLVRTAQCFRRPGVFLAPADCWGDVGAASGPLFLALAVAGGLRGYSKGPYTLLWTSSEGGERGAALIFVKPGSKTIPV
jgi:3-oxoacyl-[acyl-carrier-protein] synthase-1